MLLLRLASLELLMMNRILYNVTCSVDVDIHQEWLEWMLKRHIPDVMKTGMFADFRICRVTGYEENGMSFAVQYTASTLEDYNNYMQNFAPALQGEHTARFGDKVSAFRTVLEILHEGSISFPGVSAN